MSTLIPHAPALPTDADAPASRRELLGLDEWPDAPEAFDPSQAYVAPEPVPAPTSPHDFDLPPLTTAEFETIVRRVMLLRAERDAIAANAKAMCADLDRQIDAILAARDAQLRHHIDGGYGAKSRRCIFGLLGVRKSGGRPFIVDERLALESVQELAPSALSVNLTRLPPRFTAPGFDVTPETSSLYVQGLPKSRKANSETEGDDAS